MNLFRKIAQLFHRPTNPEPRLTADWYSITDYPNISKLGLRPQLKRLLEEQRIEMDYALLAHADEDHAAFNMDHLIELLLVNEEVAVYRAWVQARRNRADRVEKQELPAPTA